MDKKSITQQIVGWNNCTVEVWESSSHTFDGCNYLSMLWLKLIHVCKSLIFPTDTETQENPWLSKWKWFYDEWYV